MATQRLGLIMHGVTGRMGMNQHLIRSICAIRKEGSFRGGVDPVQLYVSIAGLAYFYLSNNHTLSAIFGRDLLSPKARNERLVHQDQLGVVDQRAGDRGALLHAAGQLVGIFVFEAGEADHGQQLARPLPAFAVGKAKNLRRQQDVLQHPAPFQQQRLLEHHADVARRVEGMLARADAHLAGVVVVKTRENLQQRRLAATRRADQRHQLAGLDVETRVRDGEELLVTLAIGLADARDVDEGLGHGRSLLDTGIAHDDEAFKPEHDAVERDADQGDQNHRHEHAGGVERHLHLQHQIAEAAR